MLKKLFVGANKKLFISILALLMVSSPSFASSKILDQASQKKTEGDYEAAQKLYENFLKENPDNQEALLGLGELYYWEGEYKKSIETYQTLLTQNPENVEAMKGISKSYLATGDQRKAESFINQAKKIKPEDKEVEELSPQISKKTRIRINGGYIFEDPSYAQNTQGEFQEITIDKEKSYGFGLKTATFQKFGATGFDTNLFGHYTFKEKTRIFGGVNFSPKVDILAKQGYTVGIAQTFGMITPEVSYSFQDYSQANEHFVRPAVYLSPVSFLKIGGGYEWGRLISGGTNQNLHSGFADLKISPAEWIRVNGFYKRISQGFEGGRTPSPYVSYKAHRGGGGISFDFMSNSSLNFEAFTERRDNGENISGYTFSFGFFI